ncbi:MAG: hypothetical protein ACIAQF_04265 [Phycisphaerales bacterium JB065]
MAGCLVSLAARINKPTLEEALVAFDEAAREAWASKCWEDEYAPATDQDRSFTCV